jgi:regulatory protein
MDKALHCAVRLLARREHSLAELADKLAQKGHVGEEIQEALATCQRQGLQSDARFAESLCRTRIRQGYGPMRIRQELKAKSVAREHIESVLSIDPQHWLGHARDVWEKKYAPSGDASFAEKQKQRQFLLYRGFSMETITKVVLL